MTISASNDIPHIHRHDKFKYKKTKITTYHTHPPCYACVKFNYKNSTDHNAPAQSLYQTSPHKNLVFKVIIMENKEVGPSKVVNRRN